MNPDETVATVWVVGDRADAECYAEARRRIEKLQGARPEAATLSAVMFQLIQAQRTARRGRRR